MASYMQIDPSCVLCSAPLENSNHLFFNCHYSQWILFSILDKFQIQSQQLPSITEYMEQIKQSLPGKSVEASAARIAFAAAISLIWKERNCRLFQNSANSKEYISHLILATVRNRILFISSQIRVPTASSFLARWDLPEPAQLPVIVAPTLPIHMAFGNALSENPLRVIALTCLSASGACLALLTFGYNGYAINGLVISIAGSSRPQRELTAAVQALKFSSGFSHLSIIMLSSSSPPAALILRQQTE